MSKGEFAIIGVGEVPTGRYPERTRWDILYDVCIEAVRDAGIGKDNIKPTVDANGAINSCVERLVINNVDDFPTNVEAGIFQPFCFIFEALGINVEYCHSRSIGSECFGIAQSDAACPTCDNNPIAIHFKQMRNLQNRYLR